MNIRTIRLCCIGALVLCAVSLEAQTIRGTVSDALSKRAVAGAVVTLIGVNSEWKTDDQGRYASDTVKPGTYVVKAEAPGFLKVTRKVVIVSSQGTGTPDLEVNLGMYAIQTSVDENEGSMVIQFRFPGHLPASIEIRDSKGKVVRNAYDRSRTGGMRSYLWNGKDNNGAVVPAGKYVAKVVSGRLVMIRTLMWQGQEASRKKSG